MKMLLQPSIVRRMTVALLIACGLVWVAVYLVVRVELSEDTLGSFDKEVRAVAVAAALAAAGQDDPRKIELALTGLDGYIAGQEREHDMHRGFVAFRLFDSDGRVVASGGAGPEQWPLADARSGFYEHSVGGQSYRMHRSATADGRYRIEVAQSHASRQATLDRMAFSFEGLLPVLFGFPLLLLPVWLAVHTGLSPLRRLATELASRHPADLTPIRAPLVYRELAPLARELNGALARLATMLQRERDFLADAAHQLRTPLALIGAQCDTLQQAQSEVEREAALRRLQGGLVRAGRLVNQLLALARLEADVEDTPSDTDLADEARDGMAAHAGQARALGIELSYVGPDNLKRRCPGHAFEAIVDNLVGNAVRYGRPGGQVQLRLSESDLGVVQLQVSDDGPGIAPSERDHVFERFRRGADVSATGSGLGLAIVKAAARQLGARIELAPGLGGHGVAFGVTWPDTTSATGAQQRPYRSSSMQ
jgi:two-component system, OmpR family, sensor histidine kinase QseC